jgi:hypothetical protein
MMYVCLPKFFSLSSCKFFLYLISGIYSKGDFQIYLMYIYNDNQSFKCLNVTDDLIKNYSDGLFHQFIFDHFRVSNEFLLEMSMKLH